MSAAGKTIRQRLRSLEEHLRKENPVLVATVQSYRQLDRVGRALGLLDAEESYATHISWWPLISVLGTFSAGKSTFINHYLGETLQATGNQAVDDKFTVICYGSERHVQALPGTALDADPRFPFYRISNELERVAKGEGPRVDAYLQLKTSASEKLRGRIMIDSPGFDADSQRNATLRLTSHIIDLSDLVLVFFDARHPEPGAMRDTLAHLVGQTIKRPDATKFMFILNQMDTTARDDNPEEVVGAWQRALAQEGLTAGRFHCIYNPEVAVHIEDEARRRRYEAKRDQDLESIHQRIQGVSVERAYRITGAVEKLARHIEERQVPKLMQYRSEWRRLVLWGDAALAVVLLGLAFFVTGWLGWRDGWQLAVPGAQGDGGVHGLITLAVGGLLAFWLHFRVRRLSAEHILGRIARQFAPGSERNRLSSAFNFNTRPWVSLFRNRPAGWREGTRRRLHRVVSEASQYVQILNDRYTDPSGETAATAVPAATLNPVSSERPEPAARSDTSSATLKGADT
jgi:hypothetical protein